MLAGKRILLIVSGGIAAYKTPDLVRRLKERGASVRCVLTQGGSQFVTPLALGAVSGEKVYQDLFSLTDEHEMGHIRLSREADVLLVAPASADILARMASGRADDLATTALLATDKPVLIAPAMNVRMWTHAATAANLDVLQKRGVRVIGPEEGDMACGEWGPGRMSEPLAICDALEAFFSGAGRLSGKRALITSGPTYEPIDPVRYIANRSSGKQGHAIADAFSRMGAETTLVTGPSTLADPPGVTVIRIETARQMLEACTGALPADVAVCAAAVADWRVDNEAAEKLKKTPDGALPSLSFAENPDILASLSQAGNERPGLVIGFAAETENVIGHAQAKLTRKGCDWILANDVSPETGTFGGDDNTIHLVRPDGVEAWPTLSKQAVADRLAARVADHFNPADMP